MLWTRSLLARLLVPYLLVLGAVALGLYVYGEAAVRRLYLDTVSAAALRQARLAGELLPWNLAGPALDARCRALRRATEARISVIAPDGTVLGDSDKPSAALENHRDRPEISAAWIRGEGSDVRVSRSVHVALFYRAWRQARRGKRRVVRLALPLAEIERTLYRIRSALWGGVGVAALAALIPALLISRRVARRISRLTEFSNAVKDGRPPPQLVPAGEDVVGRLEANMVSMADTLRTQLQAAREEREKLEAVLGGMVEGVLQPTPEGSPQGGPLSPLLSNVLLDDLDQELERRGLRFVRYADDFLIFVRSARSAERVFASVQCYLTQHLKLVVNQQKSSVRLARGCEYLGFTFFGSRVTIKVAPKKLKAFKRRVKQLTGRSRGISMKRRLTDLNRYLRGWIGYFGLARQFDDFVDLDGWIRRRVRMCYWKQWRYPRTKVRQLVRLGVSLDLAIKHAISRKKYWRMSRTPAMRYAMSNKWLEQQGLLSLKQGWVALAPLRGTA